MLQHIEALRKELHMYPELSGEEKDTAARIEQFIDKHHTSKILKNLGGDGLAVIYEFGITGPTTVIRCELDALPIQELNTFQHCSKNNGVSHKCGHDGHMSIVAGLIFWIKKQTFKKGKVVLLFQPAEETGQGARKVLDDQRFQALNPNYIFALHNIPGKPLHTIIPVLGNFSPTVQSIAIYLTGKESHASEPENGINPAAAISTIIHQISRLNQDDTTAKNFGLLTPIHINMGKKAYGISAGNGELHYTIRSWTEDHMLALQNSIEEILVEVSSNHHLQYNVEWFDYFPSSKNNDVCNDLIKQAAADNNLSIDLKTTPFKFGEDFGWFSKKYNSAMFGIGSGINTPALHHATYDFPDALLNTGIDMFTKIIQLIHKT